MSGGHSARREDDRVPAPPAAGASPERDVHRLAPGWRVLGWIILFVVLLLVLAPLFSSVPQAHAQEASAVLTLAAGLAASAVMLRFVDGLPFGALGFPLRRAAAGESVAGFAAGAGALGLAVAMLVAAGSVRWVADEGTIAEYVATLAGALAFFAVAAASEEVMFRGYAFQAATEGMGPWPATFLFSALFGAIHAGNPAVSTFGLANIVLAGVMLSVAYLRTRSLWFATAVHLGWNWAMGAVLDLPVSGLQRDAPLLDAVERGADWWTGGPFGPEGGAAGSVALVVAAIWLLRTRRLREAPSTRALRPLVDRRLGPDWPR